MFTSLSMVLAVRLRRPPVCALEPGSPHSWRRRERTGANGCASGRHRVGDRHRYARPPRRGALGVRVIEGETDFSGDLIGAQARESQVGDHVPGADHPPGPLFPRRLQLCRAPWRAPGQLHGAIGSKQRGHRGGVTVVDAPDIFRTQSGQRVAFVRGYVFEVEADLVHAWRPFRLEARRRRCPVSRWLKPATVFVGLDTADIHFYTSPRTYAQYVNDDIVE